MQRVLVVDVPALLERQSVQNVFEVKQTAGRIV
jgi:hypothetical protein